MSSKKGDMYSCNRCGYVITETQFFSAVTDFLCPRCNRTHLSEFSICGKYMWMCCGRKLRIDEDCDICKTSYED